MHWFLSYKRSAGKPLHIFLNALRDAGIQVPAKRGENGAVTVFQDLGIEAGSFWRLDLLRELDECDGCIFFITKEEDAALQAEVQHLIIERSWILYEASRLLHRHQLGQMTKVYPIIVGDSLEAHALVRWAVLRIEDYQLERLDPNLTDTQLQAEAGRLAQKIKDISRATPSSKAQIVENDLLARLASAILHHLPEEVLRDAILDLLVPSSGPGSAQQHLTTLVHQLGPKKVQRALADALLAGPQPRDPTDKEYYKAYFDTLTRISDDFISVCHQRRAATVDGPYRDSLQDFLATQWVSFCAAVNFSDHWIDPEVSCRRYALIYDLDPREADGIQWMQVLYEFFCVVDRVAPQSQQRDSRRVGDLRRDFDRLRRSEKPPHFFELTSVFDGSAASVCKKVETYLRSYGNQKDSRYASNSSLPLVLDTTANLLSTELEQVLAQQGGLRRKDAAHDGDTEPLWLRRLSRPDGPQPCVIILLNEREAPEKAALARRSKILTSIQIDLQCRGAIHKCLRLPSADNR